MVNIAKIAMPRKDSGPSQAPDRLHQGFVLTALALVVALGAVILGGDRVGVAVTHVAPAGTAHLTSPLRITFGEAMDTTSVEAHFQVEPPATGTFSWSGAQLSFQPGVPWSPDTSYTVTLKAGARAASGRTLAGDVAFTFRAALPKLAYLAPAVAGNSVSDVTNIWLIDPRAQDSAAQQLTHSRTGVEDFQPSPDGEYIAFSQPGRTGLSDLYLLEVVSGEARPITACALAVASCRAPSWSPDGRRLAYERQEEDADLPELDRAAPRAWILHLDDLSTTPLVDDPTALGSAPHWSPDGRRVAVFDLNAGGIVVYELATGARIVVQSMEAQSGDFAFSPDGAWLAYPQLVDLGGRFTSRIELIALDNPALPATKVSGSADAQVEDRLPSWQPGTSGARLTFTRRRLSGSAIPAAQIYAYRLDAGDNPITPLIEDPAYFHGGLAWDPRGDWLAFQRVKVGDPDPRPEIWLYDAATGGVRSLAENAYAPRWLP